MSTTIIRNNAEVVEAVDTEKKVSETFSVDIQVVSSSNQSGTTIVIVEEG